ncbi:urease accessory protein UreD [Pseudomonas chlororaphis subsp. piscium]|uniref:urease accessory protein UreD n=1 Tax=Pseudomonas chlororaphis TaxID=587753 RepID=UPI000F57D3C4|nr:urease accessory protein UreD [Pseudomonas chlororaphis]AZD86933.1 Urease accessory protein UreD [Pseudomonas chlororaphis subsp. aureofaciens]UQS88770.1 urease accessory protein UreD [Pseudomonas chlororaphis subsp. piscium]
MSAQSMNIVNTPSRHRAHTLGKDAPELANYQDEPAQMASGAPGKSGYLRLGFERREDRSVLAAMERRVPSLVQRALYWDEEMPQLPCVTMISTSGSVLQGDRLATDVHVGAGACGHITTQSATKVHSMDANYATQVQCFRIEENGYLEFMPDPLIPHRKSRFITETRISIHPTATMIYCEVLMSGRKFHHVDERFGFDVYSSKVVAENLEGLELFIEKYILEPKKEDLDATGVMQGLDIFGNVVLLTPKEHHQRILERIPALFDLGAGIASGASRLPNHCGLVFKVLGNDSGQVQIQIREFWKVAREEILGVTLSPKPLWR